MAGREGFRSRRAIGEYERRNCFNINISSLSIILIWRTRRPILLPFASAGAYAGHIVQSWEEQGISCLKYCSRTIFCTFPLFVDLMKTLLEMFAACGFER